jgi:chloramphenicol 3-O phosphotransferase
VSVGLVLVLDGPSSVGKSTTLAALQRRWPMEQSGPLVAAGLDAARAALGQAGGDGRGQGSGGRWAELLDRVEPSVAGQPPRFRYGPLGRELVSGMHRAAASWARSGLDVAMDHCIVDTAMLADLRRACDGIPLLVIGMTCDPVVLDDREADRRDVVPGRSAAQRAAVLEVHHEVVIDTTEATTDEVVADVLLHVARFRRG